ncbi:MAG TPA: hypothetical protein VM840_04415 [Actinomycetota bacterium]|nr:hypothetical protein [Actinomycetota bacterium]
MRSLILALVTTGLSLLAQTPAAAQTQPAPPARAAWVTFVSLVAVLVLVIFFTAVTGRGVGPRPRLGQAPDDHHDHDAHRSGETAVDQMPAATDTEAPSAAEEAVEAPSKTEATEDPRTD